MQVGSDWAFKELNVFMNSVFNTEDMFEYCTYHNTGGLFPFAGVFQYIFLAIILPSINTRLYKFSRKQNTG